MSNYQISKHNDNLSLPAQKKESGELSILFQLGLPTQLTQWMDICEFHLMYPNLSRLKVALHFRVSAKTVWRAYKLLDSTI